MNNFIKTEQESIANELISGKSVIVDLTDTRIDEAKRICDFFFNSTVVSE